MLGKTSLTNYYDEYKVEGENFKTILIKFQELSKDTKNIPELKDYLSNVESSYNEYDKYVLQTKEMNEKIDTLTEDMKGVAETFLENSNKYLSSQESKLAEEVKSGKNQSEVMGRVEKIDKVNEIINLIQSTLIKPIIYSNLIEKNKIHLSPAAQSLPTLSNNKK